ncbi:MAG: carotenoid oxygenase family protein [Polyangiales bacterium]
MQPEKKTELSRRGLLKLAALGGSGFVMARGLSACADDGADLDSDEDALSQRPLFVGGLTTSLREELRYGAQVRGRLPRELRGTLYKNGPGLFERGGVRKRTLLDGDGLITAYRFEGGRVEFQNRFVRTDKFVEEEAAGRFLYNTWTTSLPDPRPRGADQAGVTVWPWADRLYAFDEGNPPWELAPRDLGTVGLATFGLPREQATVFAHGKQLAGRDEFSLFGIEYGSLQYNYLVLDRQHRVIDRRSMPMTDYGPPSYAHDWFVTPKYFVVHVMPALIDGEAASKGAVLRDALRWHGELPSRMLVFRRDTVAPPQVFELEAAWMWHSANAFERGDELVLDWIGYDDPYHFVGQGAEWETVMNGQLTQSGAPGVLRRTVLDLRTGRARSERFAELEDQEFPVISSNLAGLPSRYVYLLHEPGSGPLYQAVAKVDLESGERDSFDFGAGKLALEPVFVPHPRGRDEDDGFLLVETANANTGRTELHVLDARCLADGPLATVKLRQHVPMRFHGRWESR